MPAFQRFFLWRAFWGFFGLFPAKSRIFASPNSKKVAKKFLTKVKTKGPALLPSACATKVVPQIKAAKTNKRLYPMFAITARIYRKIRKNMTNITFSTLLNAKMRFTSYNGTLAV